MRTPAVRPPHRQLQALLARLDWLPGQFELTLPPRWPTACARPSKLSAVRSLAQPGTSKTRAAATAARPHATSGLQLRSPSKRGGRDCRDEALGSDVLCAAGRLLAPHHRPDQSFVCLCFFVFVCVVLLLVCFLCFSVAFLCVCFCCCVFCFVCVFVMFCCCFLCCLFCVFSLVCLCYRFQILYCWVTSFSVGRLRMIGAHMHLSHA